MVLDDAEESHQPESSKPENDLTDLFDIAGGIADAVQVTAQMEQNEIVRDSVYSEQPEDQLYAPQVAENVPAEDPQLPDVPP